MDYSVDRAGKNPIVLYGAGKRCKRLLDELDGLDSFQVYVTDTDEKKWGMVYRSFTVTGTKEIPTNCLWCITVGDRELCSLLREKCIYDIGLHKDKEITYQQLLFDINLVKLKKTNRSDIRFANPVSNATIVFGCLIGLGFGGVEKWTINLSRELKTALPNKDVRIVTGEIDDPVADDLKRHIIVLEDGLDRFKRITNICEVLQGLTPCHIIASLPDDFLLSALTMKNGNNMMVIVVLHNDTEEYIGRFVDAWNRYGNIDCFVGVSEAICKKLAKSVPKEKVLLMPFSLKSNHYDDRKYSLDESVPVRIGYAGRMDGYENFQKRMDLIVNLARELDRRSVPFVFELAGDGKARDQMERDLSVLRHQGKVSFRGILSDEEYQSFWMNKDIAINLSDFEGHSVSQMEAMINGAVPVLSDVSGVRDDVNDGWNGFVVPKGDYLKAADRIQFLSKNREKIAELGKRAHEEIAGKATEENYLSFWRNLLNYTFS